MATLTETYRLTQVRLGALAVDRLDPLFGLLDPNDLDGTFERWLRAVLPVVQQLRLTSAQLAAAYLNAIRTQQVGTTFRPVLDARADVSSVTTSLMVTGPISVKKASARGVSVDRAIDIAQARSSAAAMRHVLNGGRGTITRTIAADRHALGYQRVTSGKPCEFCTMLADRGAVYKEDTVDFEAHDGCSCAAEPVYR